MAAIRFLVFLFHLSHLIPRFHRREKIKPRADDGKDSWATFHSVEHMPNPKDHDSRVEKKNRIK
jgi:hypothetical protein